MKVARTLLIAGSAAALAVGSAFAADKQAKSDDPGFNTLDRDSDGQLSRTEAARNPYLAKNFKAADKDGDGKLSRTEYLEVMTQKDLATLKDKATGEDRAKSDDPGFNNLDRDNDGKLSRSEAARNPYLAKRFKEADHDGDGRLSRFEYLGVMTRKDVSTIKEKVGGDDDKGSSAGGTKAK
jgi:Ca2+-binding EF-hand superfamily protein